MYARKLVLPLVVFAAIAVPALPANAATGPACGDTVTGNVVLTHNLDCIGTALHIIPGPTGIVAINLNGHRLRGNGTGAGIDYPEYPSPSFKTVSVTNGTIWGFDGALGDAARPDFANGGVLTVDSVRIQANNSWLHQGFHSTTVTNSTIIDSAFGGVADEGSLTIQNTHLIRSSVGSGGETYNYLYGDTFIGGGFHHGEAANVIAVGNIFRDCAVGISIPDVWPSAPTRVENNQFIGCQTGLTLYTGAGTATVSGNTFTGNSGDGFDLSTFLQAKITITGNRFFNNGGNGLSGTGAVGVTVANELAVGNSGHGINVTGVTDGKGNVARHNGTPPDCVGVVCTTH